ncbi:unnamed protein product [Darwinula stevensoni]|uniref:BTB domain-containing protein n=1 Tax=Darwinula stevensoni TaxID=69355 RepID=A0A7R9FQ81_9CRUS|nr:unnamed protein product [Darwinula stevensoni]CAG0898944.1 unnamed protein product [Darwinula stevensoni]
MNEYRRSNMKQLQILIYLLLPGFNEAIGILDTPRDVHSRSSREEALLGWVLRGLQGGYYSVVYRDAWPDARDGLSMEVTHDAATVELGMNEGRVPRVDPDAWDKDSVLQHAFIFVSRNSRLVNKVSRSKGRQLAFLIGMGTMGATGAVGHFRSVGLVTEGRQLAFLIGMGTMGATGAVGHFRSVGLVTEILASNLELLNGPSKAFVYLGNLTKSMVKSYYSAFPGKNLYFFGYMALPGRNASSSALSFRVYSRCLYCQNGKPKVFLVDNISSVRDDILQSKMVSPPSSFTGNFHGARNATMMIPEDSARIWPQGHPDCTQHTQAPARDTPKHLRTAHPSTSARLTQVSDCKGSSLAILPPRSVDRNGRGRLRLSGWIRVPRILPGRAGKNEREMRWRVQEELQLPLEICTTMHLLKRIVEETPPETHPRPRVIRAVGTEFTQWVSIASPINISRDPFSVDMVQEHNRYQKTQLDLELGCKYVAAQVNAQVPYCDVILKVEDTVFFSSRLILGAWSPYFHRMFTSGTKESTERELHLQGVSKIGFRGVWEFLHSSEFFMDGEDGTLAILHDAQFLEIQHLCSIVSRQISQILKPRNAFLFLRKAEELGQKDLEEGILRFMAGCFNEIVTMPEFLHMTLESLKSLLHRNELEVKTEDEVFEASRRWIEYDPDRKGFWPEILAEFDFPFSPSTFSKET